MNDLATVENRMDVNISGMPLGLAVMFNDKLYERCKELARIMAAGEGFTPPHLLKKQEACFAVVTRSLTWKLDPQAVASCTYQTPGGRIGYEGKLIQAILENSGKLVGPVRYEFFGDWTKVTGKFEIKTSAKDFKYPSPTWTRKDAEGLGVTVIAQIRGEMTERTWDSKLDEMFPLNSTLWATRPKQQICYTACRAFANLAAPGLLMGVPFDVDQDAGDNMRDITPARPTRSSFDDGGGIIAKTGATETTSTSHNVEETAGEVEGNNNNDVSPVDEYGPADALEAGRRARKENRPMRAPPEWRDNPAFEPLATAWLAGWNDEDQELKKAKERKAP